MTALYRFYDSDDTLIYVGISVNLPGRMKQHQESKTWWGDVAHVTIEHFATRQEALAAEMAAIKAERPVMNVVHNERPESPVAVDRLLIVCDGCGQAIHRFDGYLEMRYDDLTGYEASLRQWKRAHPEIESGVVSLSIYDDHPDLVRWRGWHNECDPDVECGSYFIEADRISTTLELLRWTHHLSEKSWLPETDWHSRVVAGVLYGLDSLDEPALLRRSQTAAWVQA